LGSEKGRNCLAYGKKKVPGCCGGGMLESHGKGRTWWVARLIHCQPIKRETKKEANENPCRDVLKNGKAHKVSQMGQNPKKGGSRGRTYFWKQKSQSGYRTEFIKAGVNANERLEKKGPVDLWD